LRTGGGWYGGHCRRCRGDDDRCTRGQQKRCDVQHFDTHVEIQSVQQKWSFATKAHARSCLVNVRLTGGKRPAYLVDGVGSGEGPRVQWTTPRCVGTFAPVTSRFGPRSRRSLTTFAPCMSWRPTTIAAAAREHPGRLGRPTTQQGPPRRAGVTRPSSRPQTTRQPGPRPPPSAARP
jgi:hypothetical protein